MHPKTLDLLYRITKPIIFGLNLDPEIWHELALKQIQNSRNPTQGYYPSLSFELFGHHFDNPLLLAAGFDKNGIIVDQITNFGFAGEVVGSVTAEASSGNKKPRLFRLNDGLLNRMGLNNEGAYVISQRLKNRAENYAVSIAKTHNPEIMGEKAIVDFLVSYQLLKDLGIYTEIDISCPNTTEGKTFESDPESLDTLLCALLDSGKGKPLVIKLSPNLSIQELKEIVEVSDGKVDGYVATNTLHREHPKFGKGGYSGKKLLLYSLNIVKSLRKLTDKPIIGCGGIYTGDDAYEMFKAGANLLQSYTGFVERGPLFAMKVAAELNKKLFKEGFTHIRQMH